MVILQKVYPFLIIFCRKNGIFFPDSDRAAQIFISFSARIPARSQFPRHRPRMWGPKIPYSNFRLPRSKSLGGEVKFPSTAATFCLVWPFPPLSPA